MPTPSFAAPAMGFAALALGCAALALGCVVPAASPGPMAPAPTESTAPPAEPLGIAGDDAEPPNPNDPNDPDGPDDPDAPPADSPAIATPAPPPFVMPALEPGPAATPTPLPGAAPTQPATPRQPAPPSADPSVDPNYVANRAAARRAAQSAIATAQRHLRRARGAARVQPTLDLADAYARSANLADNPKRAKTFRARAIKAYTSIVKDPALSAAPDLDRALYGLAFALQQDGHHAESRKVYAKLIKDHPSSQWIPHAYLAFGEYFFAEANLANAQRFYEKVALFPKSEVYHYALYKLAWVAFNLQDHTRALELFMRVAQHTQGAAPSGGHAALRQGAIRDLVRAYTYVGRPDRALMLFRRVDSGQALDMLGWLGDHYADQGKYAEAITVRRELLRQRPDSADACRLQAEVVRAAIALGAPIDTAREVEALARLREMHTSSGALTGDAAAACEDELRAYTTELAHRWHDEARNTRDGDTARRAARMYALFERGFPRDRALARAGYYRADALWIAAQTAPPAAAVEAFRAAGEAYARVMDQPRSPANAAVDAVAGAVAGYVNALRIARALGRVEPVLADEARNVLTRATRRGTNAAPATARLAREELVLLGAAP